MQGPISRTPRHGRQLGPDQGTVKISLGYRSLKAETHLWHEQASGRRRYKSKGIIY